MYRNLFIKLCVHVSLSGAEKTHGQIRIGKRNVLASITNGRGGRCSCRKCLISPLNLPYALCPLCGILGRKMSFIWNDKKLLRLHKDIFGQLQGKKREELFSACGFTSHRKNDRLLPFNNMSWYLQGRHHANNYTKDMTLHFWTSMSGFHFDSLKK